MQQPIEAMFARKNRITLMSPVPTTEYAGNWATIGKLQLAPRPAICTASLRMHACKL